MCELEADLMKTKIRKSARVALKPITLVGRFVLVGETRFLVTWWKGYNPTTMVLAVEGDNWRVAYQRKGVLSLKRVIEILTKKRRKGHRWTAALLCEGCGLTRHLQVHKGAGIRRKRKRA